MIGRLLRGVRAGEEHLAWSSFDAPGTLVLTSPDLADGARLDRRFAGKGVGDNVSPALAWGGVPAGTVELVLLLEDPSAPLPRPFVHLIATGLPGADGGVPEGGLEHGEGLAFGRSTAGKLGYEGPRPVPGHGPHDYVFELFALSTPLSVNAPKKKALVTAMRGLVLAKGRLTGVYER